MQVYTVSDLGRRFGVPPKSISTLFYLRKLSDSECPVHCGRRMIPEAYLPEVERVLRSVGAITAEEVGAA
jgi:hypothetical protein